MDTQVEDTIGNIVNSISAKELSDALKSCLIILESKSLFKRELINELNRV